MKTLKAPNSLKILLLAIGCLAVVTYLALLILTSVRDAKAKAVLGDLFDTSKELYSYRKKFVAYPDSYQLPSDVISKCGIQKYYYKKYGDNYELLVIVPGIVVKDIKLKVNPGGVYIESKTKDQWKRWFSPPVS